MKTIDFFGRQEKARRNTARLVVLFALAIALMILAIYVAVVVGLFFSQKPMPETVDWFQPVPFVLVALATLSIVALGSAYKIMELRGGGGQVAVMLGGRLVNSGTDDLGERRLLNVVEEMALASGVAVPLVYVLDKEDGINAFAAGLTPDDATIAMSRGALDQLSRDELQGVVAHEFSHILNGDMRFNLQLIGILHGILIVGLIGYYMLRLSGGSNRGSRRGKGGGGQIALIGLVIMVVGYVGLFFGRIIKAAVTRQREYLADASAVQFTRNPLGIGGALKKIGGLPGHSFVQAAGVEAASHMFFGSAIRHWLHSPFATHPPLENRMRAIEPQFDGVFPRVAPIVRHRRDYQAKLRKPAGQPSSTGRRGLEKLFPGLGFDDKLPIEPAAVLAAIGAPTTQHVEYSSKLVASLPEEVEHAAREPFGARCVVFSLLLDRDSTVRQKQLKLLEDNDDNSTARETERLAEQVGRIDKSTRLPLIEIAQGTLRQLSPKQYQLFRNNVIQLIKADQKIDLFEFIIQCVLLNHLDRVFGLRRSTRTRYYGIRGVSDDVAVLMSSLAHVGHRDGALARRHYYDAISPLQLDRGRASFLDRNRCTLTRLKATLATLSTCSMPIKKRILGAATLCVAADGTITVGEAELLRAVADSLDCPIPPILPGRLKARKT